MTGDMSGDGHLDLVVGSARAEKISLLRGGPGGVQPPIAGQFGSRIRPLVSADFNNVGRFDLAVTEEVENRIAILLGTGEQQFRPPLRFAVGRRPVALAAGDFNADGRLDLAVLHRGARTVMILLNNTAAVAQGKDAASTSPAPASPDSWGHWEGVW